MTTSRRPSPPAPVQCARLRLRGAAGGLVGVALMGLQACSSPPVITFHTLMPTPGEAAEPARAMTPPSGASAALAFRIDPVHVPAQVDRPQWVLRAPGGELRVLEQQRWAAPLADEWRDALGAALGARLGALDLTHVGGGSALPSYRLQLEVQRFDTVAGTGVRDDTLWTITPPGGQQGLTCRSTLTQPAVADYAALAAAHRRALDALAGEIAGALQALQAGGTARCPG
jgi:uncharacterized lipoprotein YmbA